MVEVRMSMEEYMALMANIAKEPVSSMERNDPMFNDLQEDQPKKRKRNTAYQRKYKKAFRSIAPKYKLKSGKWKKGGFRTAVKLAHKEARK